MSELNRPTLPPLMEELLQKEYGPELTAQIVAGMQKRRPVTLRVNALKAEVSEIEALLTEAGISFEHMPWYGQALLLPQARESDIEALPLYAEGKVYLQGLSAMLPVLMLAPTPQDSVLDMAAAPGGKTTQIAAETGGKASVTACERDARRCERLRFNLERQGAGRVNVMNRDARQLDDFFSFSSILLDAPCSGSGTVLLTEGEPQRRMTPDWLRKTVSVQQGLLKKALRMLQKGHRMVYSTCSIFREENEEVLQNVLAAQKDVRIVPIDYAKYEGVPLLPNTMEGVMTVQPTELYEGFFCAVLEKTR